MFSHQAIEEKVSLYNFKQQFVKNVIQLAEFSETFRPIEKFFMAGYQQQPDYLEKLCRELRSNSIPAVPAINSQNVKHITYKRNAKTMLWEKIITEEKFSQEHLNHAFEKMIKLKEAYSNSIDFLNAYLLRQEEFYRSLSDKTVPRSLSSKLSEIKKSDSTELLKNSLTVQLRSYTFLSPLALEKTITSICNILLRSDFPTPACYQQLALVIFVGRDISILEKSHRILLPEIDGYLEFLTILCVNLHQELKKNHLKVVATPGDSKRPQAADSAGAASFSVLFKAADKIEDMGITEAELKMIFILKKYGLTVNQSSAKPALGQQNT